MHLANLPSVVAASLCLLLSACDPSASAGPDASQRPHDVGVSEPDAGGADTGPVIAAPDSGAGFDAAASSPDAAAACPAGKTACGTACCAAGESCNAATSTCASQTARCYAPASFPATAFASEASYLVDQDGYEYQANHKVDPTYSQSISVALWPLSAGTALVGSFDLAKEPFDYSKCERCVLVTAGKSATDQKRYLASQGTLTTTAVTDKRIAGKLANVRLVEVLIDEKTLATTVVPGGCTLELPSLAFAYGPTVVDPRITKCFLPESFTPDQFRDFVYDYEANASGYFYRAIETPSAPGVPNLTLFVEVYRDGVGTFPLAGAETNCPTCYHMVFIEAQATSGAMKTYVSSAGKLVLTELSTTAMVGKLENVVLVETTINGNTFTPVPGGCSTRIDALDFSSRNATK